MRLRSVVCQPWAPRARSGSPGRPVTRAPVPTPHLVPAAWTTLRRNMAPNVSVRRYREEQGSEERKRREEGSKREKWLVRVSAWDRTNVTAEDVNEPAAEGLVLTRLLQAHRRPAPEVELALNSACDIINYAALDVCPACELLDGSRGQRTLQIPLNLSPPVPCRHLQC